MLLTSPIRLKTLRAEYGDDDDDDDDEILIAMMIIIILKVMKALRFMNYHGMPKVDILIHNQQVD